MKGFATHPPPRPGLCFRPDTFGGYRRFVDWQGGNMPFVYLPDEGEAGNGGPPLEQYQYEPPTPDGQVFVHFSLEPGFFALVIPELEKAGVRRAYCRYDGGYDEEFAWADYFELQDGGRIGPNDLATRLQGARLPDRLYAAEGTRRQAFQQTEMDIVNRLCSEWAALLMGEGFGTGEFSMYGAFTADLETRMVTDNRVPDPEGHKASKQASW
jgi:hypothetical protein